MNYDLGPDDQEIIRLSAQHEIMTAAYDKLILAPIDLSHPSLRILDSATANGLWLRDIQSVLPASHALVGTDINPNLFPPTAPSQTHFQVQDITKPWPEEWTGSFDLVHSRVALAGCGQFPIEKAVKNMIALIKPGGWIQLEEMELGEQAKLPRIGGEVAKLIKAMFAFGGADPLFAVKMKSWMIEAGLENVEEKLIRVPFGATCSDPEIARKGVESLTITANALAYAAKSKFNLS
jgi:hypothetical protein